MSLRHKALIISRYDFYVFNDALKKSGEKRTNSTHTCYDVIYIYTLHIKCVTATACRCLLISTE